jgi:hypothetical protein
MKKKLNLVEHRLRAYEILRDANRRGCSGVDVSQEQGLALMFEFESQLSYLSA